MEVCFLYLVIDSVCSAEKRIGSGIRSLLVSYNASLGKSIWNCAVARGYGVIYAVGQVLKRGGWSIVVERQECICLGC